MCTSPKKHVIINWKDFIPLVFANPDSMVFILFLYYEPSQQSSIRAIQTGFCYGKDVNITKSLEYVQASIYTLSENDYKLTHMLSDVNRGLLKSHNLFLNFNLVQAHKYINTHSIWPDFKHRD